MDEKQSKKTLKIFGWAAFLNDLGSDIIFPLWPLFLTSVLGANMAILGFVDGLGNAIVAISQAVSGYISDKTKKRKIFIWLGYTFAGFARLGYAISHIWQWVIPFRVLDRAGKMRGSPGDAVIADISTDSNRGINFGYLRMMDNLGAVCGVLVTIVLFEHLGFQKLFLLAAIPSLVGALLVWRYIQEPKDNQKKIFKGLTLKDFSPGLKLYIFLSAVFAIASFSYSFLLIYAGNFGFAVITIPAVYLIYNFVATITSLPFGKLTDGWGRKPTLLLAFAFWISSCALFIYAPNHVGIISAFVLYGLHLGALEPEQKTLVSELAVPELRASTLGTYQMVIGLCALPSSVIAGFLWQKFSPAAPLYFSAALTILSIILLMFLKQKTNSEGIQKS